MPKGSSGKISKAEEIRERIESNMLDSHKSGFVGHGPDVYINEDVLRVVLKDLNTLARMRELNSEDRALRDRVRALLGDESAMRQQFEREEQEYWDRVARMNNSNNQGRRSINIDDDDDGDLPF
jgi:hypothetical protein